MCQHHRNEGRIGSRLEHGAAHTEDHRLWSRRDFLLGAGAAGAALWVGGTPVRALGRAPLLEALRHAGTERVLVLVQLNGGNDGLNTVVPVEDDLYYNLRPTLAIPKAGTHALDDTMALHPSLASFAPLYGDGRLAVVQSVGYPSPDLSHFRSTDIWLSASEADDYVATGWTGRYLDDVYPDFETTRPPYPLAVQIGGGASMLLQGPGANLGMSLASTDLFDRIVDRGELYETANVPATTYGAEMAFVRTVANDAFQYAGAIQTAADGVTNGVEYPAANPLAGSLSVVARLIRGRLGAHLYLVSLGGFDTHAGQATTHTNLLRTLADATKAFYDDLAAAGLDRDVLVMTFSEFGRRVRQNGSGGTDHGTAAPLFVLGGGVAGGLYGGAPRLDDLDGAENLKYQVDFRSVYATVLQDWFGLDAGTVAALLGASFAPLGFVGAQTGTATAPAAVPGAFALHASYPNPFNPSTQIRYTLDAAVPVRLAVYDARGRLVRVLVDGVRAAGTHSVAFEAGTLPSGTYFYRLETPRHTRTRSMVLLR